MSLPKISLEETIQSRMSYLITTILCIVTKVLANAIEQEIEVKVAQIGKKEKNGFICRQYNCLYRKSDGI